MKTSLLFFTIVLWTNLESSAEPVRSERSVVTPTVEKRVSRLPKSYEDCQAFTNLETCEDCCNFVFNFERLNCGEKKDPAERYRCLKDTPPSWKECYDPCEALPLLPPSSDDRIILPGSAR